MTISKVYIFLQFSLFFFKRNVPNTTCISDITINNKCQWLPLAFSPSRVSMPTLWMGVCLCQSSGHTGKRLRHGELDLVIVLKIWTVNTWVTTIVSVGIFRWWLQPNPARLLDQSCSPVEARPTLEVLALNSVDFPAQIIIFRKYRSSLSKSSYLHNVKK